MVNSIVPCSFLSIIKCSLFGGFCSRMVYTIAGDDSILKNRHFLTSVEHNVPFLLTTVPGGSVEAAGYNTVLFHCEWDSAWGVECIYESHAPVRPPVLLTGGHC